MRIAIVTETFFPKMDGIVRMLTELLDHLGRRGDEAIICTPGEGQERYGKFAVKRYGGLRWQLYPGLTVAGPAPGLLPTLRGWQPDIIHLAGPAVLGAQATLIGRALRSPARSPLPDRSRHLCRVSRARIPATGRLAIPPHDPRDGRAHLLPHPHDPPSITGPRFPQSRPLCAGCRYRRIPSTLPRSGLA